jgi:hypothetical protein
MDAFNYSKHGPLKKKKTIQAWDHGVARVGDGERCRTNQRKMPDAPLFVSEQQ